MEKKSSKRAALHQQLLNVVSHLHWKCESSLYVNNRMQEQWWIKSRWKALRINIGHVKPNVACRQPFIFYPWKCFSHNFFFLFSFLLFFTFISTVFVFTETSHDACYSAKWPFQSLDHLLEILSIKVEEEQCLLVSFPLMFEFGRSAHAFKNEIQNAGAEERLPAFCLKTSLEPWFSPGLRSLHDDWSSKSFSEMPCQKWTTECVSSHVNCTPF